MLLVNIDVPVWMPCGHMSPKQVTRAYLSLREVRAMLESVVFWKGCLEGLTLPLLKINREWARPV